MSIRKFKRMGTKPARLLSEAKQRRLEEAIGLIERKQWMEARTRLIELNQQAPNQEEILVSLGQTYYYPNEFVPYLEICLQVCKLRPADAEHRLALAFAYLRNDWIALARRTYQEFLARWPAHKEADHAREAVERIEVGLQEIFQQMELSGEGAYELAELNEEAQWFLKSGRFRDVIFTLENLLKRNPDDKSAFNNLSQAHFQLGQIEKAIDLVEHVLALDAGNVHALGSLSRYLLVSGREEQARQTVERLKQISRNEFDRWMVQAQSCAELGDDEGVLEALAKAQQHAAFASESRTFFLLHLAAVAALRQGNENEARRLWSECLLLSPAFDSALENLADLDAPVRERNGPWAFRLHHWISVQIVEELRLDIQKAARRGKKDPAETVRQFSRKHPTINALLPILLDRGDRLSRDFACDVAGWAKTPETLALLRAFGLGQRGSNEQRLKALQILQRLGVMESDRVQFWSGGEWIETRLKKTEVYYEPESDLPPQAQALYLKAYEALSRRDGIESERLLRQALELVPDSPQLLNNLSASYLVQGRKEAAEAIAWQVHLKHPEYLFARASLANRMIERKQYTEAQAMLEPLEDLDRLHVSEAVTLYSSYIHLHFKQGEIDKARHWLATLEVVAPDDPETDRWRERLG